MEGRGSQALPLVSKGNTYLTPLSNNSATGGKDKEMQAMEPEREPSADERDGMDWWNSLPESERAVWLAKAQSAKPSDAWAAYKRAKNAPEH